MSIRHPFRDWSVESTIGLLAIILTITLVTGVVGIIGVAFATLTTPEPAQTVTQETITTGDVKRLCLVVKTGDHVDAVSCQLIDDITGGVK